jgi:hypothetical protein
MNEILFQYHRPEPTTWVYISTLLSIGLFFKFNRFWSIRNLDLILVLLLAPGLVMATFGREMKDAANLEPSDQQEVKRTDTASDGSLDLAPAVVDESVPEILGNVPAEGLDVAPEELNTGAPSGFVDTAADGADVAGGGVEEEKAEERPSAAAEAKANLLKGERVERLGYIWLFITSAILFVRLMTDPTMVRRPLLEPNLTAGALIFTCCSLFFFLMANVVTGTPTAKIHPSKFGPGYRLLYRLPEVPVTQLFEDETPAEEEPENVVFGATAKVMAILSQLAIVMGIILIGYRHFDNIRIAVGAAAFYLLLPYTAQMTGLVDHVLPAALLVWAIYFYRQPLLAGVFIGLAGVVYYPLFLLPLWLSFYWHRGKLRFLTGFAIAMACLVLALIVFYGVGDEFRTAFGSMFGIQWPVTEGLAGFWNYYPSIYRLPLLAAFFVLSFSFALWPAQKNLGTLMCCTAAIMVAAQFWHRFYGGTYMAWYMPLLLLTIFRPNLEDRVALAVLGEGWFARRRANTEMSQRAA